MPDDLVERPKNESEKPEKSGTRRRRKAPRQGRQAPPERPRPDFPVTPRGRPAAGGSFRLEGDGSLVRVARPTRQPR